MNVSMVWFETWPVANGSTTVTEPPAAITALAVPVASVVVASTTLESAFRKYT